MQKRITELNFYSCIKLAHQLKELIRNFVEIFDKIISNSIQ